MNYQEIWLHKFHVFRDCLISLPAGGNVQIHDEKLNYRQKAQSKVGSLEKASHKPAGGDVKVRPSDLENVTC